MSGGLELDDPFGALQPWQLCGAVKMTWLGACFCAAAPAVPPHCGFSSPLKTPADAERLRLPQDLAAACMHPAAQGCQMIFNVPPSPDNSMIVWFYKIHPTY